MKIIFTCIILCFAFNSLFAQGTLQFSQVKLIGASETVPADKVWKVSNIIPTTRLTSAAGGSNVEDIRSTTHEIIVDGTTAIVASSDSHYSASTISVTDRGGSSSGTGTRPVSAATSSAISLLSGSIWLPESTTLAAGNGVFRISVIEFNVVP